MRRPAASDAFRLLRPVRKLDMLVNEALATRRTSSRPRLFNLDLHIAVIRDIAHGLQDFDVDLTRWSISGHNAMTRRAFRFPDPVDVVNARTWNELDVRMIDQFRDRYGRYLKSFDGFVTTHTPAFAELYADTGKPQLIAATTRYEAPYSDRPADWSRLNGFLRKGVTESTIHLLANNRGDADYLAYFTGIHPEVVASMCDYLPESPPFGNGELVVMGRHGQALRSVTAAGRGLWRTVHEAYGTPYRWEQLAASTEVFVLPYNISTMTLFELATAGTPVAVPGAALLRRLAAEDPTILSELSYYQVRGLQTDGLDEGNPNNFRSERAWSWWLERADFYDLALMPNVRIVQSLDELVGTGNDRRLEGGYWDRIQHRNHALRYRRREVLKQFIERL